jgi:hypothetical protein
MPRSFACFGGAARGMKNCVQNDMEKFTGPQNGNRR